MRPSLLRLLAVASLVFSSEQNVKQHPRVRPQHPALPVYSIQSSRYSSQSKAEPKLELSELKITLRKGKAEMMNYFLSYDNRTGKDEVNLSQKSFTTTLTEEQMKTVEEAANFLQKAISIRHKPNPNAFQVKFDPVPSKSQIIEFVNQWGRGSSHCAMIEPKDKVFTIASNEIVILVISSDICQDSDADLGNTLAYASACRYDANTGRPVMGVIGICDKSSSKISQINTQIHELLHALAFSSKNEIMGTRPFPLARRYTFQEPLPWLTRDGYTTNTVTMVNSPKIVEEAKKHFDCPNMKGLELESQGGGGTSFAHWETRIFGDEMMVGEDLIEHSPLSRMTLALLDSTGWYEIDYSVARDFVYGKNRGCDFLEQSCLEYTRKVNNDESLTTDYEKWQKTKPYCRVDYEKAEEQFYFDCSLGRKRIDTCIVSEYKALHTDGIIDSKYWYFPVWIDNDNKFGLHMYGGLRIADYCPVLQNDDLFCADEKVKGNSEIGEVYAKDARCLDLVNTKFKRTHKTRTEPNRGGCYRTKCEDGKLHFKTANMGADEWFTCEKPGDTYTGVEDTEIYCPSCNEICPDCGPGTNFKFDEPSRYHGKPPIVKPPGGGQGRTTSAATGVRASVFVVVGAALLWFSLL